MVFKNTGVGKMENQCVIQMSMKRLVKYSGIHPLSVHKGRSQECCVPPLPAGVKADGGLAVLITQLLRLLYMSVFTQQIGKGYNVRGVQRPPWEMASVPRTRT